jgi:hypothetical protein
MLRKSFAADPRFIRSLCMCGCDQLTYRRFCPGHDATLYHRLIRDSATGVPGAAALLQFIHGNDDESTFVDQRKAVVDYLTGLEGLAAD